MKSVRGRFRVCAAVSLLAFSISANAETVYVTEHLTTVMHETALLDSPIVKAIESGAPLELLERGELTVRVRDRQGAEGWIESRFVSAEVPARMQLTAVQAELTKTRGELKETLALLKQAQDALEQEKAKSTELQKAVAQARPGPESTSETTRQAVATGANPSPIARSEQTGIGFSFLWIGIAFAMLVLGFFAGVIWLRESIRRRSGGMYLRV